MNLINDRLIDTISYFTNGLGFRPKFKGNGYENLKILFWSDFNSFSLLHLKQRHTGTDWKPQLVTVMWIKDFKARNKEDIIMNFVFFTGWTDVRENVLAADVIDLKDGLGKIEN